MKCSSCIPTKNYLKLYPEHIDARVKALQEITHFTALETVQFDL